MGRKMGSGRSAYLGLVNGDVSGIGRVCSQLRLAVWGSAGMPTAAHCRIGRGKICLRPSLRASDHDESSLPWFLLAEKGRRQRGSA